VVFVVSRRRTPKFRRIPTSGAFALKAPFSPQGDQPRAIAEICEAFQDGCPHQTLLGVTGSGKTYTMAHVIARLNRPALVIAPNKTLAAQLFAEFKEFFPDNAVEFFISYYDYFQPEAYVPSTDTYIAKDSAINDDIDKMRHAATRALFERRDVIIVASVSCIYGLGSPEAYSGLVTSLERGKDIDRDQFLRALVDINYTRNDAALARGGFRVRGNVVDVMPSHHREEALRIEFDGSRVERISLVDALTGTTQRDVEAITVYPNSHYVTDRTDTGEIVREILADLATRLQALQEQGRLVEYQRLEQRVMHDIEMIEQLGYCPGIENYSRYLNGLPGGAPPPTLLDYFPRDFITIIDESHITVPQVGGMYRGDRSRKSTLVDFGFRLPSALDNRPLNFEEFLARNNQILYVSATPGPFELRMSGGKWAEQIIRPTGLIDPEIEVRPARSQVDDLYGEIARAVKAGGRVLVTTLTKKMAEDLTRYYCEAGLKVRYLHADIESLERLDLLRDLRQGVFDVLIGINLLREGLDLPEVRLVAVMDADKEGFLRSRASLIQIVGRAARNVEGKVIFYAEKVTDSMREAMAETTRRRTRQMEYNREHGITPQTINKAMPADLRKFYGIKSPARGIAGKEPADILKKFKVKSAAELDKLIRKKTGQMQKAAGRLEFEEAARLRDEVNVLKDVYLTMGSSESVIESTPEAEEPVS
jgi:excinuclease ABC subunit B